MPDQADKDHSNEPAGERTHCPRFDAPKPAYTPLEWLRDLLNRQDSDVPYTGNLVPGQIFTDADAKNETLYFASLSRGHVISHLNKDDNKEKGVDLVKAAPSMFGQSDSLKHSLERKASDEGATVSDRNIFSSNSFTSNIPNDSTEKSKRRGTLLTKKETEIKPSQAVNKKRKVEDGGEALTRSTSNNQRKAQEGNHQSY